MTDCGDNLPEVLITDDACPPAARQMIAEAYPGDGVDATYRRALTEALVAGMLVTHASNGEPMRLLFSDTFYAAQAQYLMRYRDVRLALDPCSETAKTVARAIIDAGPTPTHNTVGWA